MLLIQEPDAIPIPLVCGISFPWLGGQGLHDSSLLRCLIRSLIKVPFIPEARRDRHWLCRLRNLLGPNWLASLRITDATADYANGNGQSHSQIKVGSRISVYGLPVQQPRATQSS